MKIQRTIKLLSLNGMCAVVVKVTLQNVKCFVESPPQLRHVCMVVIIHFCSMHVYNIICMWLWNDHIVSEPLHACIYMLWAHGLMIPI